MGWVTPAAQTNDTNVTVATSTPTTSALANTTTGNALFVGIVILSTATVSGMTISSGSASFARVRAQSNGSQNVEIWAAAGITGGTTPTITVTLSASSTCEILTYEFSGGGSTIATDGQNSGTGTSTTPTSGSFTTTVNNDLLFKTIYCAGGGTLPESSWTDTVPTTGGNCSGYVIKGTAGSTNGSCTQGSSSAWIAVAAGFKVTATIVPNTSNPALYYLCRSPYMRVIR